jgi:hypothetical protein
MANDKTASDRRITNDGLTVAHLGQALSGSSTTQGQRESASDAPQPAATDAPAPVATSQKK